VPAMTRDLIVGHAVAIGRYPARIPIGVMGLNSEPLRPADQGPPNGVEGLRFGADNAPLGHSAETGPWGASGADPGARGTDRTDLCVSATSNTDLVAFSNQFSTRDHDPEPDRGGAHVAILETLDPGAAQRAGETQRHAKLCCESAMV
jgi:hypothetical protein